MRIELNELLEMKREIKDKVSQRMSDKVSLMPKSAEDLMYNLASIVYQMDKEFKEYFIVLFETFFVSKGADEGEFEHTLKKFEFEVNELHTQCIQYTNKYI